MDVILIAGTWSTQVCKCNWQNLAQLAQMLALAARSSQITSYTHLRFNDVIAHSFTWSLVVVSSQNQHSNRTTGTKRTFEVKVYKEDVIRSDIKAGLLCRNKLLINLQAPFSEQEQIQQQSLKLASLDLIGQYCVWKSHQRDTTHISDFFQPVFLFSHQQESRVLRRLAVNDVAYWNEPTRSPNVIGDRRVYLEALANLSCSVLDVIAGLMSPTAASYFILRRLPQHCCKELDLK